MAMISSTTFARLLDARWAVCQPCGQKIDRVAVVEN
jgi:hypothetical protein